MAETPRIYFLNQTQQTLDWFFRGPSKARAEELGWDLWVNDTGAPIERERWA